MSGGLRLEFTAGGIRVRGHAPAVVAPGGRVPRHLDTTEEVVVVTDGVAEVSVGERAPLRLAAGGMTVIRAGVPHEIRNAGDAPLRVVTVHAAETVAIPCDADLERALAAAA